MSQDKMAWYIAEEKVITKSIKENEPKKSINVYLFAWVHDASADNDLCRLANEAFVCVQGEFGNDLMEHHKLMVCVGDIFVFWVHKKLESPVNYPVPGRKLITWSKTQGIIDCFEQENANYGIGSFLATITRGIHLINLQFDQLIKMFNSDFESEKLPANFSVEEEACESCKKVRNCLCVAGKLCEECFKKRRRNMTGKYLRHWFSSPIIYLLLIQKFVGVYNLPRELNKYLADFL